MVRAAQASPDSGFGLYQFRTVSWWRRAHAREPRRESEPIFGANQLGAVRDVAWATPQWSDERWQKPPLRAVCNSMCYRRATLTRVQLVSVCARTHQDARARSSLPFILPTPSAAARPAQGERHRLVAGSTLSALPGPASSRAGILGESTPASALSEAAHRAG